MKVICTSKAFFLFSDSWANDIALVRLEEPVPSGPDVPEIGSVTLTAQGERRFPADGQICIMKGWGCTQSGELSIGY